MTPNVETAPWAAMFRRSAAERRGKRQLPIVRTLLVYTLFCVSSFAQTPIPPDWCRALPRPEYKTLKRVRVSDPWFEVYEPATHVFAIYEPHQAEETIAYLIVGTAGATLRHWYGH